MEANYSTSNIGNIAILQNIVIEKAIKHKLSGNLPEVSTRVYLAASSVLKDYNAYFKGNKKITKKQIKEIKDEYERIQTKIQEKFLKETAAHSLERDEMDSKLNRIRNTYHALTVPSEVESLMADFYQVLACNASYAGLEQGSIIPGPDPRLPDYRVYKNITNDRGLQITVLVPNPSSESSIKTPPICYCRGTTSNPHNLIDDFNDHIGEYSLEISLEQIESDLKEVTDQYGQIVITGHSLGGAIAQNLTAEFCDKTTGPKGRSWIKACYHFNAPGVGEIVAHSFKEKKNKMEKKNQPKVFGVYHIDDLVFMAGGKHLQATTTTRVGNPSLKFNIVSSWLKAHSLSKLVSEFSEKRTVNLKNRGRKFKHLLTERFRQLIAPILNWHISSSIKDEEKHQKTASKIEREISRKML